jgi:CrcB protein
MPTFVSYVWVAAGGAFGSVARYALASAFAQAVGERFPWGTIAVNISGCFVIGLIGMATAPVGKIAAPVDVRQFLMIGICGGYTTFSSFSLQTLTLLRSGAWMEAGANVAVSLVACMVAVWLGAAAGEALSRLQGG